MSPFTKHLSIGSNLRAMASNLIVQMTLQVPTGKQSFLTLVSLCHMECWGSLWDLCTFYSSLLVDVTEAALGHLFSSSTLYSSEMAKNLAPAGCLSRLLGVTCCYTSTSYTIGVPHIGFFYLNSSLEHCTSQKARIEFIQRNWHKVPCLSFVWPWRNVQECNLRSLHYKTLCLTQ